MSGKKRGLGRGLDALLGGSKQVAEPEGLPASREDLATDGVLRQIPVDRLREDNISQGGTLTKKRYRSWLTQFESTDCCSPS